MLLAIDTSTRNAGVALARDGQVVAARSWRSAVNHTAELMPAVANLLEGAGLSVQDLDGIAVALGPGRVQRPPGGHERSQGTGHGVGQAAGGHRHPGCRSAALPAIESACLRPCWTPDAARFLQVTSALTGNV